MIEQLRTHHGGRMIQVDCGNLLRSHGTVAERRLVNREILATFEDLGVDLVNATRRDLRELERISSDPRRFRDASDRPAWETMAVGNAPLSILIVGSVNDSLLQRWKTTNPSPEGAPESTALIRIAVAALDDVEPSDLLPLLPEIDLLLVSEGKTNRRAAETSQATTIIHAPAQGQYIARLVVRANDQGPGLSIEEEWLSLFDPKLADPMVAERIDRLNDLLHEVQKDEALLEKASEKTAQWVGAEACGSCHEGELALWKKQTHASAMKTLIDRKKEFDHDCVSCHVTGWDDGFVSYLTTPELVDVQCEACHGSGRDHAEDPSEPTPLKAIDTCIKCHTEENSPEFDLEKYLQRVRHW